MHLSFGFEAQWTDVQITLGQIKKLMHWKLLDPVRQEQEIIRKRIISQVNSQHIGMMITCASFMKI